LYVENGYNWHFKISEVTPQKYTIILGKGSFSVKLLKIKRGCLM
jgi:hypothetical protein